MAVEFKPNDVSYRGMSQYKTGQIIPCVIFRPRFFLGEHQQLYSTHISLLMADTFSSMLQLKFSRTRSYSMPSVKVIMLGKMCRVMQSATHYFNEGYPLQ